MYVWVWLCVWLFAPTAGTQIQSFLGVLQMAKSAKQDSWAAASHTQRHQCLHKWWNQTNAFANPRDERQMATLKRKWHFDATLSHCFHQQEVDSLGNWNSARLKKLSGHMDLRMRRLISIDNLLWFRKKKLYCVFVTKELVKLRDLTQHKAQVFMSELQFKQGSLKTTSTFLVNSYAHCVPLIYLIMFCFIYGQNSWSD